MIINLGGAILRTHGGYQSDFLVGPSHPLHGFKGWRLQRCHAWQTSTHDCRLLFTYSNGTSYFCFIMVFQEEHIWSYVCRPENGRPVPQERLQVICGALLQTHFTILPPPGGDEPYWCENWIWHRQQQWWSDTGSGSSALPRDLDHAILWESKFECSHVFVIQ